MPQSSDVTVMLQCLKACLCISALTVLPSLSCLSSISLGCFGSRALLVTSSTIPTAVTPNTAITRCQSFNFCRSVEMIPFKHWDIVSCKKAIWDDIIKTLSRKQAMSVIIIQNDNTIMLYFHNCWFRNLLYTSTSISTIKPPPYSPFCRV